MNLLITNIAAYKFAHDNNVSILEVLYIKESDEIDYKITLKTDTGNNIDHYLNVGDSIKIIHLKERDYDEALKMLLSQNEEFLVVL